MKDTGTSLILSLVALQLFQPLAWAIEQRIEKANSQVLAAWELSNQPCALGDFVVKTTDGAMKCAPARSRYTGPKIAQDNCYARFIQMSASSPREAQSMETALVISARSESAASLGYEIAPVNSVGRISTIFFGLTSRVRMNGVEVMKEDASSWRLQVDEQAQTGAIGWTGDAKAAEYFDDIANGRTELEWQKPCHVASSLAREGQVLYWIQK